MISIHQISEPLEEEAVKGIAIQVLDILQSL